MRHRRDARCGCSIPTTTWLVLLAGIVAVVAVSGIVSRAQRPLGWALAAIVLAAALHPAVAVLDRRMPRASPCWR
ncbi:MAG: hypothetical protein WKF58_00255 [Ilumatobacteraceae bacterium]